MVLYVHSALRPECFTVLYAQTALQCFTPRMLYVVYVHSALRQCFTSTVLYVHSAVRAVRPQCFTCYTSTVLDVHSVLRPQCFTSAVLYVHKTYAAYQGRVENGIGNAGEPRPTSVHTAPDL